MPYLVGYVTPQDYGAVGDGVNDDTTEIQAALDAANVNGSTVFFPPGIYLISASLVVNNSGTIIMGSGWGSQIRYDGSVVTAGAVNAPAATKRVFIRDIRISQTNTSHLGTGVDASNFVNGVIERVLIDGGGVSGVAPNIGVQMNASTCHYNVVRECRINYGGTAAKGVSIIGTSHSNTVQDCRLVPQGDDVNSSGVYITNTHSTTLIHPDVESGAGNGIFLDTAAHGTTIVNAYCDSNNINLKISTGVIAPTVLGGTYEGGVTANTQDNGAVGSIIMNAWPNSGTSTFSRVNFSAGRAGGNLFTVANTTGAPTSDNVQFSSHSAGDATLGILVAGDTVDRLAIDSNGQHRWGAGGVSAADVQLTRSVAGTLAQTNPAGGVASHTIGGANSGGQLLALTNSTSAPTNANLLVTAAAAGDISIGTAVSGDTNDRLTVDSNGKMQWGPGNAVVDTNLYRSAANTLTTDDSLAVGINLSVVGVGRDIFVVKSASTSRNTTVTPTADPNLTVSVAANATYMVQCVVAWTNGGGGFRCDWGAPAGATMVWTDNDGSGLPTLTTQDVFSATTGTTLSGALVTTGTSGTFALQWAQNTSNAANTTLLAGCYLWLRRVI